MPPIDPPKSCPGTPQLDTLAVGTVLWRIHSAQRTARQLNRTPQPAAGRGGRFDALAGDYGYLYLGDSPEAAIAETICRNLPLADPDARFVPRAQIAGRLLSRLQVTEPITVVIAHGAALTHLGQDLWLTKSQPADYLLTRKWAAAIREWAPGADGLVYRCRHDEDRRSWMLTADPTVAEHPSLTTVGDPLPLDNAVGRTILRSVLVAYNATIA